MFQKMMDRIYQAALNHAKELPHLQEVFEQDPIAEQTQWIPAAGGGANFKTKTLVQLGPDRLSFQATTKGKIFPLIFVFMGSLVCLSGFFSVGAAAILVPFGGIFVLAGSLLYHYFTKPINFDRGLNLYWRGKKDPSDTTAKGVIQLQDVHAIQLVSERIRSQSSSSSRSHSSRRSSYYSYELNLVLHDATRINVVDHGKLSVIRQDADRLADFLDIPVWDAI